MDCKMNICVHVEIILHIYFYTFQKRNYVEKRKREFARNSLLVKLKKFVNYYLFFFFSI